MSQGTYYYSISNDNCYLKMKGDLRYSQAVGLENFLEKQFAKNEISRFVIDLTEAEWLDSTNLGILGQIARYLMKKKLGKPVLVSSNEELNLLMDNIGLKNYFRIVQNPENFIKDYQKITIPDVSGDTIFTTVKKAHEQLIELDPRNRKHFRELMKLLEKNSH